MTRYPWIVPQEHKRNWRVQLGGAGTEDWNMNRRLGRLERSGRTARIWSAGTEAATAGTSP